MNNSINQNNTQNNVNNAKEEAGNNTAHVAGKAAANYFGGPVGGMAYNAFSKTKIGQNLEKNVGNTIAKTPGLGNLNKKLNDTGAVGAANNAVDMLGNKNGGKFATSANTGNNLKKSGNTFNKNKSNNSAPKAIENHKKKNYINNFQTKKQENKNNDANSENLNDDNDSLNEEENDLKENKTNTNNYFGILFSKKAKFIILISVCVFFLLLIFIVIMSGSLGGATDTSLTPISSANSDETNSESYYDKDEYPDLYEQEVKFNNSIGNNKSNNGIIGEYQSNYGVTLNFYMLEATLLYRDYKYYLLRIDNMTEDEYNELVKSDPDFHNKIYDFEDAEKYVSTVAELMICSSGEGENVNYYTDINKNGEYYNKLLNSSFLTEYYKKILDYEEYNDKTKLVDEIFDYAEYLRYAVEGDETSSSYIISDSMKVHLQTCKTPYSYKTINNIKVYNNPSATTNEEKAPSVVSLVDYGVGVLYGELGSHAKKYANGQGDDIKESLKAFLVASYSYMLGQRSYGRSGLDLRQPDLYYPSGNCRMVCCNPNTNSHYKKYNGDKYGTCMATTSSTANHPALSQEQLTKLRELVSEVFGEVMVEKGVTADTFSGSKDIKYGGYYSDLSLCKSSNCLGQKESLEDSKNGMTYKEILAKYYDSTKYDIINIKEGLYVQDENYSDASYDGNVIFYDQSNYKNVKFCGRSNATISSSGCGVTATAIVISSLTGNKSYDPTYMMNLAYSYGDCGYGISGTNVSFFKKAADKFNFEYKSVSKSQASQVIEALKTGKSMVIAHMGAGHFTSGGHYIVLSAINSSGKVYVQDPNNNGNKKNRGTGNGWYDINMIASELKSGFYIITKR